MSGICGSGLAAWPRLVISITTDRQNDSAFQPNTRQCLLKNGPFFVGGIYQMLPAQAGVFDHVVSAFRNGGGVSQSQYTDMMWDGLERLTSTWFENLLLQLWIPAMPDVKAHLERGCDVADVGCGRGRGLIKLAQAFPRSRYIGYDNFGPTVARAIANAREAGVSDRVRFEERDVSKGLPEQFDVITTFDVVHDAVDPLQLLQSIHRALRPGGVYVCLDINCSDKLEENANPLGAMFHGVSVFYCMTTSLANKGADLARSVFTKPRFASSARRPDLAESGVCRWKTRSTTCTKRSRRGMSRRVDASLAKRAVRPKKGTPTAIRQKCSVVLNRIGTLTSLLGKISEKC